MANSTLVKFGFPDSLIRCYEHWCVLLRPAQVTLGSLVLGSTGEATSFSQIPPQAFAETQRYAAAALTACFNCHKPLDKQDFVFLYDKLKAAAK